MRPGAVVVAGLWSKAGPRQGLGNGVATTQKQAIDAASPQTAHKPGVPKRGLAGSGARSPPPPAHPHTWQATVEAQATGLFGSALPPGAGT